MLQLGMLQHVTDVKWCVQICKPKDFAMQINLNMDNCWGIIRALADLTLKLDEGEDPIASV